MKFDFSKDFKLNIEVDNSEKLQLTSEYSKLARSCEPMVNWFNSPDVSQAEKEQYNDHFTKAMAGMNFMYNLLKYSGFSDEEIIEITKLPF